MGPVILLSVAVLAAGAAILYWTLGPQPETAATGSAAPPLPSAVNEITARSFDADQSLANAWRKARAWDPDAALASLTISSVSSGKPDPSSNLVATFAKPKGRFGPGAEVGSARYVVTVTLDNQKTGTSKSNQAAKVAPDPACPVAAAWRAAVASGLPSAKPLSFHYAFSDKHNRATWVAKPVGGGDSRQLDGVSCNILAR